MSEQVQQPPTEETHLAELVQLRDFVQTHGKTLTIALAVVLVAALGVRWYRAHKQATVREASSLFATARSVQDLEALVTEYASAPSATLAKLRLAKSYFDAANYELAMKTYREIKEQDPQHPLAAAADLGITHCEEAMGQTEESLRGFEEFLAKNPGHFLAPEAVFGKARCLDQQNRTADAKSTIEDYIAAHPDSRWLAPAQEMLKTLSEKLKSAPVVQQAVIGDPSSVPAAAEPLPAE